MKKALVFTAVLLFVVTSAFAQFVPSPMTLTAPATVNYDFDGSDLEIPVTVAGAPAQVIFCVFTKDKGADIGYVKNGYLTWHYVNNIDTCVFYTTGQNMAEGDDVIVWNGKNQDDALVPAGDYYYYLYGFDYLNFKIKVVQAMEWILHTWSASKYADHMLVEKDFEGNLLPKPIIYFEQSFGNSIDEGDLFGVVDGIETRSRWYVGNEPLDTTLMESTSYPCPGTERSIFPDPYAAEHFITKAVDGDLVAHIRRFEWVGGGESVQDMDWGDSGVFNFNVAAQDGWDAAISGCEYVGEDVIVASNSSHYGFSTESELVLVDATDGTEMRRLDVAEWWVDPDDADAGGQASGGPNQLSVRDGRLAMASHGSCMFQVLSPSAGTADTDWMIWSNGNGDIIGDRNNEEGSEKAWVCIDYTAVPNTYVIHQDANYFTTIPTNGLGNVAFALFAPDGTGIGYYTYTGEGSGPHHANDFIDVEGAYDGNYLDNVGIIMQGDPIDETTSGIWYLANDSFKGVITSEEVGVDAAAPAAFAVAQNSPNPFNPTTTISFSLVDAGNVTVDVFNVAGQKVDTLVNDFMAQGSHSVVWNASNFSAGVYFYTVKSGDFSKTMKMTLVK